MLTRLLLVLILFVILNIGSFVRLQIFQNSISSKEFKVFMIIFNIAFLIFAVLYVMGVIRIK